MKKLILIMVIGFIALMGAVINLSYAQNAAKDFTKEKNIHIQIQNNSLLPRRFTIKLKGATQTDYGVASFFLFSYSKYTGEYPVGTSVYLVTTEEKEVLMKGEETPGKLILTVKAEDQGKTFKFFNE